MRQYGSLKREVPDCLLLFRMGDFYELFHEDAVVGARILEIALTSREKNKENPTPMAGIPHHSAQGYIQKLLKAGKKVAIAEQMGEPSPHEKLVIRQIVRILTPGVHFDPESSDPNYLGIALFLDKKWILACLDASTGEVLLSRPLTTQELNQELDRLPIRHFLYQGAEAEYLSGVLTGVLKEVLPPSSVITHQEAIKVLESHYPPDLLKSSLFNPASTIAIATLILYVLKTQHQKQLTHLQKPQPLRPPETLILGPQTAEHLDLAGLFRLIDHTRSTLGRRELKRWLHAPFYSLVKITQRQEALQECSAQVHTAIAQACSDIYDLERLCGKLTTGLAQPQDTLALGQSLSQLKVISTWLKPFQSVTLRALSEQFELVCKTLLPLATHITSCQKEDAPPTAKEGGVFLHGFDSELDRLLSLSQEGEKWLLELEKKERESTGIPSLKVRYNRVFGYFIEITQSHLKNVPPHYQRKQTMVGAERFFTEELKKFEEEILTASIRQKQLEHELFLELLEKIKIHIEAIMLAAQSIGTVDALLSLSKLVKTPGWCFPKIDSSLDLNLKGGRHPLVDSAAVGSFIPNDLHLSSQNHSTLIITGPNMGGKSTFMRQTALILILGQMGAPVPAKQASWGIVSSIYTRIGAQDAITRGQSTFMVEMSELAHILHHADERSFIILDEIGRGTSTYDGISVAGSTLEWISKKRGARTLFATHYHELTQLEKRLSHLANAHMAVQTHPETGELRFLYQLQPGPSNESFGIQVAQLAGLPHPVIERAWEILKELENTHSSPQKERTILEYSI